MFHNEDCPHIARIDWGRLIPEGVKDAELARWNGERNEDLRRWLYDNVKGKWVKLPLHPDSDVQNFLFEHVMERDAFLKRWAA